MVERKGQQKNMRYAGLIKDDFTAAPGVCVSVFVQGCPHHCPGCFNPETWDFEGGKEFTFDVLQEIKESLNANGIKRSLCVLGGEPLCPENIFLTYLICDSIRNEFPDTKIYIWTGYTVEELMGRSDPKIKNILNGKVADILIDGQFKQELRDVTLKMRGSSNQRIIELPVDFE